MQKTTQGALVCGDWPGEGPAKSSHYFAARDLPEKAHLKGRIFILFGCHTAGTPRLDSFEQEPAEERRVLTDNPFVAPLPQAMLSHPEGGALAVIAHVERAFPGHIFPTGKLGKSFHDFQIDTFEDTISGLLNGATIGLAMEAFGQRQADIATRLVANHLQPGDNDLKTVGITHLWLAYNDARSYIVLGDPAVRLEMREMQDDQQPSERHHVKDQPLQCRH